MTLGVIILNWNQSEDTIACVRRVQAWRISDLHIWVVDNGSHSSDWQRLASALPAQVELIRSEVNLGFAGGNNLALTRALHSRCSAVMLLNNDAHIEAEAVHQMQLTLEQQDQIGVVGPVLVDAAAPHRLLSAGGRDIARNLVSHHLTPLRPDEVRFVDYVPGTCVMIRTQVLHAVGLLDEAYFFGGELADLCARAKQAGWLCAVIGSAVALHAINRSASVRQQLHAYYVIRNRFRYIRKFHHRLRIALFTLWTFAALGEISASLARRQLARARAIGLGCLDGWRGRFGGQNARVTRGQVL